MTATQNQELIALFESYTSNPNSIGAQLTRATASAASGAPLIVGTATDIVVFPGGGAPPSVEGFRLGTLGFKELAAISHLGPALASLVNLRALEPEGRWREEVRALLEQTERARRASSPAFWEAIDVEAYRGRERAISDMIDYACDATAAYLRRCLDDRDYLSAESLRRDYLEGGVVPFDHVMVATFFLTSLDIAFRVLRWFGSEAIDWDRAMVLITGKQGRTTAGVTWNTSSVAALILGASRGHLALDRLYMAPHAPSLTAAEARDMITVRALEQPLRELWSNIRATQNLAPVMFAGYPRFTAAMHATSPSRELPDEVSEMPPVRSADDMRSLVARMRVTLEDPRQLLSGCVMDFAVEQLVAHGNTPADVTVPGLTGVRYPGGVR